MNYNNIKTQINAQIRENGNQEITGAILNSVLLNIVSALGEGYQFGGIINPSSPFSSVDGRFFWFCEGEGVYVNYGGLEVFEGDITIIMYDGEFSKGVVTVGGGQGVGGAVRFDIVQTLSSAEKAQAKANIGVNIEGSPVGEVSGVNTKTLTYGVQDLIPSDRFQARRNVGMFSRGRMCVRTANHRGFNSLAPENTLPAFKMSKIMGYDTIECDVQFTADGVPVIIHDETIDRTSSGSGSVASLNYDELLTYDFGSWFSVLFEGTKIPTLRETLLLCKDLGMEMYLELKGTMTQSQIEQIATEVFNCGMRGKVTYIAFYAPNLEKIARIDKRARIGILTSSLSADYVTVARGIQANGNYVFFDISIGVDVTSWLSQMSTYDIGLEYWTIDDADVLAELPDAYSGITSNSMIAEDVLFNNVMN